MTVTPTPSVTALPTAPQRLTDLPSTFVTRADAYAAAQPTFGTELSAVAVAAQANATAAEAAATSAEADAAAANASATAALASSGYVGASTASLAISAGAKAVTGVTGKSFANGDDVYLIRRGGASARMHGVVSAANMGAGTMTVTVAADGFTGSGTHTDWIVALGAFVSPTLGLAADLLAGTSAIAALTADAVYDAMAEVTLTDAATVSVDMAAFINAKVTLAGNRTLGAPTNPKVGQTGRIRIIQDATGSRTLAFHANWKFKGGVDPTVSAAAAAYDTLEYDVVDATTILADLIKGWA